MWHKAAPAGLAPNLSFILQLLLHLHTQKPLLNPSVGKKRSNYTFWGRFNEKPSIVLGCPEVCQLNVMQSLGMFWQNCHCCHAQCAYCITWCSNHYTASVEHSALSE